MRAMMGRSRTFVSLRKIFVSEKARQCELNCSPAACAFDKCA